MDGQAAERRLRVLVVDDHELFRTGLRALLEEEGFEVVDASSAGAALRRLPSFAPDVVVMDMSMPVMGGVEATPLVLEAAPGVPVLMLRTELSRAPATPGATAPSPEATARIPAAISASSASFRR